MNNNYYKLVLIFDNFNIKICCLINCIVVGYLLIIRQRSNKGGTVSVGWGGEGFKVGNSPI